MSGSFLKHQLLMVSTAFFLFNIFISCQPNTGSNDFNIAYEKYELENGLDVILHRDTSNPIASVVVTFHAGSTRETPGKTGLAHFVEHMLFQKSANLEKGEYVQKINNLGGWYNGGTSNEQTSYYEVFPKDALEKVLWMESDRLYTTMQMINEKTIEIEKPIILNEKNQNIANSPYGYTYYSIVKNLYPENHPYNWEVIGETNDVKSIDLSDVQSFYKQFYGPNNTTLIIAGDIDTEQTKKWVDQYFGRAKSSGKLSPLPKQSVSLIENNKIYFEDKLIQLPELTLVFPAVEGYHEDAYALDLLAELLAGNPNAPLYNILIKENALATQVDVSNWAWEIAGSFRIRVRANPDINLDQVYQTIQKGFTQFENEIFTDDELLRIKKKTEINFYQNNTSIYQKAITLAMYNTFAGTPDSIKTDIQKIRKVSKNDIIRVYEKYISGKSFLATSIVPIGRKDLALKGSKEFKIDNDELNLNYTPDKNVIEKAKEKSAETMKSNEPEFAGKVILQTPATWNVTLKNGLSVYGHENKETPMVEFSFLVKTTDFTEYENKAGIVSLLAEMLLNGQQNDPLKKYQNYGVQVYTEAKKEHLKISVTCLASDLKDVLMHTKNTFLNPAWDEATFNQLKQQQINQIIEIKNTPRHLAGETFATVLFGSEHPMAKPVKGTETSVSSITFNDLKKMHRVISPSNSFFHISGNANKNDVLRLLNSFSENWENTHLDFEANKKLPEIKPAETKYVNSENISQSFIYFGKLLNPANITEKVLAEIINLKLGGNTNSLLFDQLRNKKQLTYGVTSDIYQTTSADFLLGKTIVPHHQTQEALQTIQNIFEELDQHFNEDELELLKTTFLRNKYRAYETNGEILAMLEEISSNKLPLSFAMLEIEALNLLTVEKCKEYLNKQFSSEDINYVIVSKSF